MSPARSYVTILFALILGGGYAATAPGCVVQLTDCDECNEAGVCHSFVGSDGMCYCEAGYEWANPGDSDNFDCDRIPPKPLENGCNNPNNVQVGNDCFCACGFTWCSSDSADLTCCVFADANCEDSSTDPIQPGSEESTAFETGTSGEGSTGSTGGGSTGGGSTGGGTTAAETGADGSGSGSATSSSG
jgi:hypothetical protein